jgi:hypothetical protein
MKNSTPHPLEGVVMQAFAKRPAHDAITIAYALAGAIVRPSKGARAYRTVATDVIGYMAEQGKIAQDDLGWWRLRHASDT